jgi:acetylornithine deacetylase/succinyl-diaminopimelate desuccinylase-like protein
MELWTSPHLNLDKTTDIHPEGAIFARGACDDKGQMYIRKSIRIHDQSNTLPCNVKFMIEGEEEEGSVNLKPSLKTILKT